MAQREEEEQNNLSPSNYFEDESISAGSPDQSLMDSDGQAGEERTPEPEPEGNEEAQNFGFERNQYDEKTERYEQKAKAKEEQIKDFLTTEKEKIAAGGKSAFQKIGDFVEKIGSKDVNRAIGMADIGQKYNPSGYTGFNLDKSFTSAPQQQNIPSQPAQQPQGDYIPAQRDPDTEKLNVKDYMKDNIPKQLAEPGVEGAQVPRYKASPKGTDPSEYQIVQYYDKFGKKRSKHKKTISPSRVPGAEGSQPQPQQQGQRSWPGQDGIPTKWRDLEGQQPGRTPPGVKTPADIDVDVNGLTKRSEVSAQQPDIESVGKFTQEQQGQQNRPEDILGTQFTGQATQPGTVDQYLGAGTGTQQSKINQYLSGAGTGQKINQFLGRKGAERNITDMNLTKGESTFNYVNKADEIFGVKRRKAKNDVDFMNPTLSKFFQGRTSKRNAIRKLNQFLG